MQLLEHWDPLSMPRGSVRALVTLALLGILWAQMLLGHEVSVVYASLVLLTMGHYFGSRNLRTRREQEGEGAGSALWLPRGTIRGIIIVGFAVVGTLLWREGRLAWNPTDAKSARNSAIFILIAALLAGFLVRGAADLLSGGRPVAPRRWFENIKSAVTLVATAMLVIVTFVGPEETENRLLGLVGAMVVGFYFGSRY